MLFCLLLVLFCLVSGRALSGSAGALSGGEGALSDNERALSGTEGALSGRERALSAAQNTLAISSSDKQMVLTPHFRWLPESGKAIDVTNLHLNSDASQWRTSKLPSSYVSNAIWLKVTFTNTSADELERYLVFDSPLLDNVDLYLFRDQQIIERRQHRLTTPVAYRTINHRLIILPMELPANSETTLYLRVYADTSLQLGASLWEPKTFLLNDQHWLTLHVFLLGMMGVMALYNLAIYVITKIRAYLLYVSYVLSIATFQACMAGFAHQYLFGSSSLLLSNGQFTIACIAFVTAAAFIDELLKLKLTAPLFHRTAQFLMAAWSMLFCISFMVPEATIGPLVITLAMISPVFGLWIGIYLWRKGYEIAPLFTMAWALLLVGTFVFVLMINGLIERNLITAHIQEVGAALEVVLLAITLAKRLQVERHKRHRAQEHAILMVQQVNNERQAKLDAQATALDAERKTREAQEKLVETQIQANMELEQMVEQRTLELKTALERVEEMNQQLEKLSITDALTGAYNRRYFDEQLEEQIERAISQKQPLGLALIDIDYFKKINDEHGHLIGDQCLKLIARLLQEQTRKDVDIVARFGGEEFAIIAPDADEPQLRDISDRVRRSIADTPFAYRDVLVKMTASIGIAELDLATPQSQESLLQQADDALYQSKQQGRNRTTFSSSARRAQS